MYFNILPKATGVRYKYPYLSAKERKNTEQLFAILAKVLLQLFAQKEQNLD